MANQTPPATIADATRACAEFTSAWCYRIAAGPVCFASRSMCAGIAVSERGARCRETIVGSLSGRTLQVAPIDIAVATVLNPRNRDLRPSAPSGGGYSGGGGGGPVYVHGYTRRNGTFVHGYTRRR